MAGMNGWLMALSFLLGVVLTFAFTIRRVTAEVPATAPGDVDPRGVDSARDGPGGSGPGVDDQG